MNAASSKDSRRTWDGVLGGVQMVCALALVSALAHSLGSSGGDGEVPGPLVLASVGAILVLMASGARSIACAAQRGGVSQPGGAPARSEERPVPSLGRFLVEECRLVSGEDLERALARQSETGRPLGETLVEMGLIREADLANALRVHWGLRNLREE